MSKRLLPLLFLFFSINAAQAVTSDFHDWALITFRHNLTEKYSYSLHFQNRVAENWSKEDIFIIRPSLRYKITPNLFFDVGYDWFSHYQPEFSVEHRPWQQILVRKKLAKFKTYTWFRLEERFLDGTENVSTRFRIRPGFNYPITKNQKLSFDFFAEMFLNLNGVSNGPAGGFDQFWIYSGLNYKFNKNLRLLVGYLMSFQDRSINNIDHAFRTVLSIEI